ncbi:MAG TPA: hypothetical protein VEB43_16095 [Anaeromyxobacter sp.]|nr:hypothetical protein [Anaeromyxobacter sp.]
MPAAILGLLILASYSHAHAGGDERHARTDPNKIRVLNAPPAEPFEVVDSIVVEEDDLEEALEELREEAAERGGDAVVVTFQTSSNGFWSDAEVSLAGDVIRFTKPRSSESGTPPESTR